MRVVQRSWSVFTTLLLLGIIELTLIMIIGGGLITSISQIMIPSALGMLLGSVVSGAEFILFHRKHIALYHPTKLPYYGLAGLVLANVLFYSLRIWIGLILGSYIVALAIYFCIYENTLGEGRITWGDIL